MPDASDGVLKRNAQPAAPGKRTYFPELDGVRAIAIAMVMIFHLSDSGIQMPHIVVLGQTGVDLFFVLSGFLITGILLKAQQHDWQEVRTFYVRRTLRIFPLYYGALLLLWMGLLHRHVSWDVWTYLQSFTLAFHRNMQGPNHFWSLSVEEQFYLVWPFLVLFLARKRLPWVMAILFLAAFVLRLVLLRYDVEVFYWTLTRMDGLAAGAFVAWLQYQGKLADYRRVAWQVLSVSLVVLLVCTLLVSRIGHYWPQVFKYSAFAGFYASGIALILTSQSGRLRSFLTSTPLRKVGRVSYGLYVFHPIVYSQLFPLIPEQHPLLRTLAAVVVTGTCAYLSWTFFEKPLLTLKERVAPERTRFPLPEAERVAS